MWNFQKSDELYHYGIMGMKWGVRRYQNTDGSLTAAGRKRYSDDYNTTYNLKRKGVKRMSNDDLRKVNDRDTLERNYKNNNSYVKKGAAVVAATAGTLGAITGIIKNSDKIVRYGKTAANKILRK